MIDNDERLERVEKKLDQILDFLHRLGMQESEMMPSEIVEVRTGSHDLMPSDEELRKRSAARI